ncbi:hypothetical protein F0562_018272 [Nyssa sinensis]|uniref:Uncharacterized protein n=1 Tax=Nyssa sinensis TaxID=561372 RepID=A0A5J4ZCG3_9ASTE|nr:hypothetical protein F0562_018272 [Nyssa sinensis]
MDCGLEFNPTLGPLQLTIPEDELGVVEALFPLLWSFEDNPEPPPQDNLPILDLLHFPFGYRSPSLAVYIFSLELRSALAASIRPFAGLDLCEYSEVAAAV